MQNALLGEKRVLRPVSHLRGQTHIITAVLLTPVFASVFWFAIPRGSWPRVVVALVVIVVVYSAAAFIYSRVAITIYRHSLFERGFFFHNRVASKRIESALILTTYRGQSLETVAQLFLLDTKGETLLRMRGQLWSSESIETMASAFDVPVRRIDEPLTWPELRRDYRPMLYWFERWPLLGALITAGLVAALSLLLILLMSSQSLVVAP